jgi:hypothetical protein
MRSRIIIEVFEEDEEKDRKQKDLNGPLHDLLAQELCRIFKLYSDVDRSNPVSTIVPVVPMTNVSVRVENVSDLLSSIVTEDSVVTLGPLKIPAKILLSLFGRFFESKKIRGSLSYSDQELILIASYSGGERCHCWKVHRQYPLQISLNSDGDKKVQDLNENSSRGLLIHEMIEELSYRIFTDLTEFHSFRWEATKEFMTGLECYRACLLEPKEKISKLLEAESAFMRALSEDVTFATGWYNLGVVYTELRFMDAATMAFYKSFERERHHPEAFYALAQNFYNAYIENPDYGTNTSNDWKDIWKKRLKDALFFCEQAELLSKKKGSLGFIPWKIPLEFLSTANPEIYLLKGRLNLELFYLTRQFADKMSGNDATSIDLKDKEYAISRSHLSESIDAFYETIRYSYREWANLDYYRVHASLFPLDENGCSLNTRIKWDNFRERVAELGWAYIECAANQTDVHIKKILLETSSYIFAQGLTFDPKRIDMGTFESEIREDGNFSCSPQISQNSKKLGSLSETDATCILSQNLPNALYLWKCGVLSCSVNNFSLSDYFLRKALVQNPRAFLFQTSHILVKILRSNNQDPDKISDYWWHALQHARNAYNADKNGNDYQWGYITEFAILNSKFNSVFYQKISDERTKGVSSLQEKNRLTPLILESNLTRSGAFGKYLLSIFSIFEILSIQLDNDKDFIKKLQEKINFEDSHIVANELIILESIRSKIYQKVKENPTIHENEVLGYIDLHKEWVIGQIYLTVGHLNRFDKENAKIAQFSFSKSRKYLGQYGMELGHRGIYAYESLVESNEGNFKTAISKAWQSHWKDSTGTFEHMNLGSCQFDIGDFTNAQVSLQDAEFWGMQELSLTYISLISINRAASFINKSRDYPFVPHDKKDGMRNKCLE